MQFSAKINGADKVQLGLRNLGAALPDKDKEDVKKMMQAAAYMSVPYRGGASYDIAERGYVRTGNLGRSVTVYERGLTSVIEAKAYDTRGREYTSYVIGDGKGSGQATVHQGYWTTMWDAVNSYLDLLIDTLDKDNQALIDQELG